MRGRRVAAIGAFAVAGLLGGCGGAESSAGSASDGSSQVPSEADKSVDQIIADARAALAQVSSFHVAVTEKDSDGSTTTIGGDVALPGRLHLTLEHGTQRFELIFAGGKEYLEANGDFWTKNNAGRYASVLADRWVTLPTSTGARLKYLGNLADSARVADCLLGGVHGTLSKGGTEQTGGKEAVVIVDAGGVPGGAPGKLWVATSGPALPLRADQTGPTLPGGPATGSCGEDTSKPSKQVSSDSIISAYNAPVTIEAPPNPVDLNQLAGR